MFLHKSIVMIDPALDYLTLDGIRMKIGVDPEDFPLAVLKERLDNHISAAEKDAFNPRVFVLITDSLLVVGNNGEPFPISEIYELYNPHYRATSKILPLFERGLIGHYLKVEAGIQSINGKCVILVTREKSFKIRFEKAGNTVKPIIEETNEKIFDEENVTEFHLPMNIENVSDLYKYAMSYVCCNPHVTFIVNGREFRRVCEKSPVRFSSARWFETYESFKYALDLYSESLNYVEDFLRKFTDRHDILTSEISKKPLSNLSEEEKRQLYSLLLEVEEPQISLFAGQDYVNRLKQIVDVIKYGYTTHIEKNKQGSFIYALEILAAKVSSIEPFFYLPDSKRGVAVICCVNSSPLFSNIWYGSRGTYFQYGSKGEDLFDYIAKRSKGECNFLMVNLLLPKPSWTSYSKNQIAIGPYLNTFKSLLKKTLLSLKGSVRVSNVRKELEKEIRRRISLLEEYGEIPPDEWTTQNGLWYKVRKILGGENEMDLDRKKFLEAVDEICRKYGYSRDQLGITCAPRGEFYYKGEVYPLTFENIEKLAQLGTDIVHIEKEGVPRALKDVAKDYPIALTHSRGFLVEYGKRLLELAKKSGAHIVMITDLDDSGLAMKYQLPGIIRIGVDEQMLEYFGLQWERVREKYTPGSHLKFLMSKNPREAYKVSKYRVEIDSILAEVGPSRLLEYIVHTLKTLYPTRDYNRAINVTPIMPSELEEFISTFKEYLQEVDADEITAIRENLKNWRGLEKTVEIERMVKERILTKQMNDELVKEVLKKIGEITAKIREKRGYWV